MIRNSAAKTAHLSQNTRAGPGGEDVPPALERPLEAAERFLLVIMNVRDVADIRVDVVPAASAPALLALLGQVGQRRGAGIAGVDRQEPQGGAASSATASAAAAAFALRANRSRSLEGRDGHIDAPPRDESRDSSGSHWWLLSAAQWTWRLDRWTETGPFLGPRSPKSLQDP